MKKLKRINLLKLDIDLDKTSQDPLKDSYHSSILKLKPKEENINKGSSFSQCRISVRQKDQFSISSSTIMILRSFNVFNLLTVRCT